MAVPKTHISISTGTLIRIAIVIAACFAVVKLRDVILVVLTAIVIASFVESAVRKMKRFIKNRALAVFIVYLISISLVVGLMSVFVPVFVNETSELLSQSAKLLPKNSSIYGLQVDTLKDAQGLVSTISNNGSLAEFIKRTQGFADNFSVGFISIFGTAFGSVVNLLLIIIISFYLSVKEKGIENFLRIVIPARHEEYVIDLWQRTERKIGLWLQSQLLLGVVVGVLTYIGLTLLGVKYALVLSLLTACFELIPFGTLLAVVPAVVFSYIDGGMSLAFMVAVLYFVIHQFEAYLIYPLIVKKMVGVPQLVVILSLIVGYTLAGFWGVVLAIPAAVCLLEFMDDLEKRKNMARLG